MLEWIAKYWLQVLFGLIATGFGFLAKHFYKLLKEEKNRQRSEQFKELSDSLKTYIEESLKPFKQYDESVQKKFDELATDIKDLRKGLLSIQGREFKLNCELLLTPEHVITVKEYTHLVRDHDAYNSLGGNSEGDALFEMVKQKYEKNL